MLQRVARQHGHGLRKVVRTSIFHEARRRSGFGGKRYRAAFAAQLGIADDRLAALECGSAIATVDELDQLAMLLGVEMDRLDEHAVAASPMAHLLLRAQHDRQGRALAAIAPLRVLSTLGDFVRVVGIVARLEPDRHARTDGLLQRLDRGALGSGGAPPYGADRAAAMLRSTLQLQPDAPIASMRRLLDELGVATFWVDDATLDPSIDGASTATPAAAVLVNLVGGPACWWRTRMTLAHELGHLLLDHQAGDHSMALVSPRGGSFGASAGGRRSALFDGFDVVEARANAFAAHLLVPDAGVRRVAGHADPTAESTITAICREFGVGRTVAIHRLCHVFGLSPAGRRAMELRGRGELHDAEHLDIVRPDEIGLRGGQLRASVMAAVADGLDVAAARVALRLPMTEPLPATAGVDPALLRPLQKPDALIRRRAQRLLDAEPREHAHFAGEVSRGADGWVVRTVDASDGTPGCDGTPSVHVSFDLERAEYARTGA